MINMISNEENFILDADAGFGIGDWLSLESGNQPDKAGHHEIVVLFLYGQLHPI
jgi:hypothetical protein